MLTRTFVGLAGLSIEAERMLWRHGILDWNGAERCQRLPLSPRKADQVLSEIRYARAALSCGLVEWFLARLPVAHALRVLTDFAHGMAFLDIETTGLSHRDHVTSVAVYQNGSMHLFVRGINLVDLLGLVPKMKVVVTFNGTRFDLPFLRRDLGLPWAMPHIDLRNVLGAYGFRGSQKKIEKTLGFERQHEIADTDGEAAVLLWHRYMDGDRRALRRLLRYNAEDAWMMVRLALTCFQRTTQSSPVSVKMPNLPEPDVDEAVKICDL